jgi:hypothetical protein
MLTYFIFLAQPYKGDTFISFAEAESRGTLLFIPYACRLCEGLADFLYCCILRI